MCVLESSLWQECECGWGGFADREGRPEEGLRSEGHKETGRLPPPSLQSPGAVFPVTETWKRGGRPVVEPLGVGWVAVLWRTRVWAPRSISRLPSDGRETCF